MVSELDLTKEDLGVFEAQQLVKGMDRVGDLVDVVINEKYHWAARNDAAQKLIDMYLDGNMSVDRGHLAHVGRHADDPYKTQANEIIRDSL